MLFLPWHEQCYLSCTTAIKNTGGQNCAVTPFIKYPSLIQQEQRLTESISTNSQQPVCWPPLVHSAATGHYEWRCNVESLPLCPSVPLWRRTAKIAPSIAQRPWNVLSWPGVGNIRSQRWSERRQFMATLIGIFTQRIPGSAHDLSPTLLILSCWDSRCTFLPPSPLPARSTIGTESLHRSVPEGGEQTGGTVCWAKQILMIHLSRTASVV
jgi:hypothetical protein